MEGTRAVSRALETGLVRELFLSPACPAAADLRRAAAGRGVTVHDVAPRIVDVLSDTATPQGVVAVAHMSAAPLEALPAAADLVLVLAQVRDPGNAGTLVRSAVGAAAQAVVFTEAAVDPFAPKTVRSSAGAILEVPIVRGASLLDAVGALRGAGLTVVGADSSSSTPPDGVDLRRPVALVLGNEAWGMSAPERALMDELVGIPMPGPLESLNVAVAGSILLFEAVRQRARWRDA